MFPMGGGCIAQNINGAKRQQQLKFLSFNYSTENELFDKLHASQAGSGDTGNILTTRL